MRINWKFFSHTIFLQSLISKQYIVNEFNKIVFFSFYFSMKILSCKVNTSGAHKSNKSKLNGFKTIALAIEPLFYCEFTINITSNFSLSAMYIVQSTCMLECIWFERSIELCECPYDAHTVTKISVAAVNVCNIRSVTHSFRDKLVFKVITVIIWPIIRNVCGKELCYERKIQH